MSGIVSTGKGVTIINNAVTANGSEGTHEGTHEGIHAVEGSIIMGNAVHSNTGVGLLCVGVMEFCGYGHNVFTDNNSAGDQVSGSVVEIATNLCGTNTTCP